MYRWELRYDLAIIPLTYASMFQLADRLVILRGKRREREETEEREAASRRGAGMRCVWEHRDTAILRVRFLEVK